MMWHVISTSLLLAGAPLPAVDVANCDGYRLGAVPTPTGEPTLAACIDKLSSDVEWVRDYVLAQRKAKARGRGADTQRAQAATSVVEIEAAAKKITDSLEPMRQALGTAQIAPTTTVERASREIRVALLEIEANLASKNAQSRSGDVTVCTKPWAWPLDKSLQRCDGERRIIENEDAYAKKALAAELTLRSLGDKSVADLSSKRDLKDALRSLMTTLGLHLPTNDECAPYLLKSGHNRAPDRGDPGIVTVCVRRLQDDLDWAVGEFESGETGRKRKAEADAKVKNALDRIQEALKVAEDAATDAKRQDAVKEAVAKIQKAANDITAALAPSKSELKTEEAVLSCRDAWLYFDRAIQGCDQKTGSRFLKGAELAEYVNRAHFTLGRLDSWERKLATKWEKAVTAPTPNVDPDRAVLADAKNTVHSLMGRMGLRRPFSGVFVPALGFVTTGAQPAPPPAPTASPTPAASPAATAPGGTGNSQGQTTTTEAETATLGYVAWESKHIGRHEGATIDLSLAGKFGFQRIFDMVKPDDTQEAAAPAATFQSAFVWDLGPRLNWIFPGRLGELGLLGRTGQTRLNSDLALVKLKPESGKQAVIAPLATATGRTKWYYEAGVRVTIFGDKFEQAHEQNVLDPMFFIAGGLRRDDRLKGREDLKGYAAPQDRWFFQFALNRLPVIKGNETFKVTFAVEHEWARHKNSLTSGTKLLVQGHLDLLSAFGSKSQ